jgi:hypothetical protein
MDDHVDPLSIVDVDLQTGLPENGVEMPEIAGHGE